VSTEELKYKGISLALTTLKQFTLPGSLQ